MYHICVEDEEIVEADAAAEASKARRRACFASSDKEEEKEESWRAGFVCAIRTDGIFIFAA